MKDVFRVQGWLRERYPHHAHAYFGLSGAALLYEALQAQNRSSIVLPAFTCPNLSAMAVRAGKRVVHMDTGRGTLHLDPGQLESFLAGQVESDTVVLVDHSFGYPFPGLADIRRKFPDLLLIEDCVRALGVQIPGGSAGEHSDWILLSMYKTIRGSQNGSVLLTRTPISANRGEPVSATVRERAATVALMRFFYDLMQRRNPPFGPRQECLASREWTPQYGFPSELCMARFATELSEFEARGSVRNSVAAELTGYISPIGGIKCFTPAPGCQSAGHFVSLRIEERNARDAILARLHRKGLFLSRTWDLLPTHYNSFSGTFPAGHSGTDDLAEHIAHIPVRLFLNGRQRRRLVHELRNLASRIGRLEEVAV